MARKRRRSKTKKTNVKPDKSTIQDDLKQTEKTSSEEDVKAKAPAEPKPTVKPEPAKTTSKKTPGAGSKMNSFFRDVRAEMKKVSWPDGQRTAHSTGIVIFTLVVLAGFMTLFTMLFTRFAEYFFS